MLVLGIDPGKTTGVCMLRVGETLEVVMAEQIPWETRKEDLWALFTATFREGLSVPLYTVVENFRLRPGRAMEQVGSTFPSVEVIGLIEAFQFVTKNYFRLVYQEPAIISRVQILPEHASCFVGKPHAADAYRHARFFCVTSVIGFSGVLTQGGSKGIHVDLSKVDNDDRESDSWAEVHGYE